ncbi:tRNA pseudouridine(54/55) synthase Pus10 [Halovivax cerinus]|uniref:tRNA pseudouridine synthase Pus10 n=1 Tax=Halovivax cerinus TaxID=1487865 RepID=A0ABD5NRR2_9EURY|nr:tRNA pseudouridine(54/55) synthase Pus10 [Halovivax cerinus]
MTITDAAADLLAGGPVCDACLGRPFADRSFGLRNEERGRALRTTLALEADEPYEPVDPVECWVCEGYCGTFDALADAVVETLDGVDFATYQVGTVVPPLVEENDRLLREDAGMEPDAGEPLKREVNREVGRRVGARTGAEVDFERPDVLCVVDLSAFDPYAVLEDGDAVTAHAVDRQINPAFVYGRYRKIERDIPQTEWPCRECGGSGTQLADDGEEPCDYCGGSGYLYDTSIEETVRPHVVDAMEGREGTFHGAGREDVDARMLGTGRPFVLEVKHPYHRTPDVSALEAEINEAAAGAVEVEDLRLATHDMVERVKEHDASKRYRAAVQFDEPVSVTALDALAELEGTTVEQFTPQRVDHRRAELTRERTVYAIDGEPGIVDEMVDSVDEAVLGDGEVNAATATIEVHGAGGLYIKELISGDDGRTEPSVAGLLDTGAEVIALDVLAVEGEDEPFERADFFVDESDADGESGGDA